jgi:peptidoglycan/xylan/chitin deacetylase (PgdA/CDA1 family)
MTHLAEQSTAAFDWQKRLTLNLYYYASWPYRASLNRRLIRSGQAPVMVLFYHRIADTHPNLWTASNRTFARQMAWLQRHFELVSLSEAQRRLAQGRNERPCVSITFDDGYAENCEQALPLLVRERIPCTYFVTTRNVIDRQPFPHDVQRGRPLEPNSPDQIMALADAGIEIGCHTRHHLNLGQITDEVVLYDEIVTAREELQDLIGGPVRYFAFPYGHHVHMSSQAIAMARETGYAGICSAFGGFNFAGEDPFHLQRIHADDDLIRLKNWVTVDPRKLRESRQFAAATRELLHPSEASILG